MDIDLHPLDLSTNVTLFNADQSPNSTACFIAASETDLSAQGILADMLLSPTFSRNVVTQ